MEASPEVSLCESLDGGQPAVSVLLLAVFPAEKLTDRDLVNSILDVEDLVRFGNKQRFDVLLFTLQTVCTLHTRALRVGSSITSTHTHTCTAEVTTNEKRFTAKTISSKCLQVVKEATNQEVMERETAND